MDDIRAMSEVEHEEQARNAHHPRVQFCPYEFGSGQKWYPTDSCDSERIEASRARFSCRQDFDLVRMSARTLASAERNLPLLEGCNGCI